MKILKFGGTSLSSDEGLKNVFEIVNSELESGAAPIIVVSAIGGITDKLEAISKENRLSQKDELKNKLSDIKARYQEIIKANINKEEAKELALSELEKTFSEFISKIENDSQLLGLGEKLSLVTFQAVFKDRFNQCENLNAEDLILVEENENQTQTINYQETYKAIKAAYGKLNGLSIIAGFLAKNQNDTLTNLGRGSSNFTATIVGAALDAEEIQIWSHVDGILTANPQEVKTAKSLSELSFEEAMELSHFGAKVISSPSMQPASEKNIPIRIKNTLNPTHPGTLISNDPGQNSNPKQQAGIKGISTIDAISLITIEGSGMLGVVGVAKRLFSALNEKQINVILISQASSEHSICVAVKPEVGLLAKEALEEEFKSEISSSRIDKVSLKEDLSVIAVVGQNMKNQPGVAGRVFQSLGKNGISAIAIAQGSSELNISIVISAKNRSKALLSIHDSFFISESKTLNLFLIGTGAIGSELIKQISEHADTLARQTRRGDPQKLAFSLKGIANSKQMYVNNEGISLDNWRPLIYGENLAKQTRPLEVRSFVAEMISMNLPNSIFIDCTSSEEVAEQYENILAASIAIVTPNKKANSGKLERYKKLKDVANKATVKFFYETNVGAGLPIIGTLNDLISSGDKVQKIEAILSGTLSYIFNTFNKDVKFSSVVKEAKAKGYTEPDPRDDLSGSDVARKLLILARDMGVEMEYDEIEVESLIPSSCSPQDSIEEFLKKLEADDENMAQKIESAAKESKVLRYIGTIQDGKAKVSVLAVGQEHPFYSMSGTDNIISFTTNRYLKCPLVVKGPGAGIEVTAAGVFADIVRVGTYLV